MVRSKVTLCCRKKAGLLGDYPGQKPPPPPLLQLQPALPHHPQRTSYSHMAEAPHRSGQPPKHDKWDMPPPSAATRNDNLTWQQQLDLSTPAGDQQAQQQHGHYKEAGGNRGNGRGQGGGRGGGGHRPGSRGPDQGQQQGNGGGGQGAKKQQQHGNGRQRSGASFSETDGKRAQDRKAPSRSPTETVPPSSPVCDGPAAHKSGKKTPRARALSQEYFLQLQSLFPENEQMILRILQNHPAESDLNKLSSYILEVMEFE